MKDDRLWRMKIEASRDPSLSDGAFRLLCRICDHLYQDRHHLPGNPFPLPWSLVNKWCFIGEDQAYRRLRELEGRFLKRAGIQGSPPITHFFLVLNSRIKAGIDSGKKAVINSGKKAGDHISTSLKGKNSEKERGKEGYSGASRPGGKPTGAAAPGAPAGINRSGSSASTFDVKSYLDAWRREQGVAGKGEGEASRGAKPVAMRQPGQPGGQFHPPTCNREDGEGNEPRRKPAGKPKGKETAPA